MQGSELVKAIYIFSPPAACIASLGIMEGAASGRTSYSAWLCYAAKGPGVFNHRTLP